VGTYIIGPHSVWNSVKNAPEVLIVGVDGGMLVNEMSPLGRVSLVKDEVTLMPEGQPFRLRNGSDREVRFRVIEIEK
jgi:hypothetical protein